MKKAWGKDEDSTIISLLKAGKTYEEIGLVLSRSSTAIRLRSNRLGYKYLDFNKRDKQHCLNCNKEFKGSLDRKFCSKSCSAIFTLPGRVLSKETRDKISKSNKGKNVTRNKRYCSVCSKVINYENKTGKCGKCLSIDPEYKERFKKALKGKVGGYRIKGGNPHHKGSYYEGVWMDSSWEKVLAERLNSLDIKWVRGSFLYLNWVDDDKIHHKYYPDFYLPNEDLYIEIKGFWREQSRYKMKKVLEQNVIKIIILESKKDIEKFEL